MEWVVLVVVAGVVAVLGFGIGMLAARRIGRWTDRDDEDQVDDRSR
jgi:hypothetical protein